jgi:choline/glycine/proline betaine transport protein
VRLHHRFAVRQLGPVRGVAGNTHFAELAAEIVEAPVPIFSGRMSRETDVYFRLEVFTQTGSGGYDLMGLTMQQIIDDVLDRYEAHLAFLSYPTETDTASVLTPRVPPATGPQPALPKEADDIQDLDDERG